MALMSAGAQAWAKGLETWGKMLGGVTPRQRPTRRTARTAASPLPNGARTRSSTRSARPICGCPTSCSARSMRSRASIGETREKLRFATRSFVDAMSPSNFALTNPQVLKRTLETRGENLLKGLANMLKDIASGQLTQTKPGAFEVGRNLATTPGKVVKQTAALPADPVHADDRRGAEDAGRGLPAVDQPLLHPRPHAREKLRQMVRRPGHHPVHGQLEIGRREHRRRDARRLCAQGPDRRDRHRPRPARRRERPRDRLLRRRHDARRDARLPRRQEAGGQGQVGDLLHRAGRFQRSRRPQAVHRRRDHGAARPADRRRRAISTAATWPRPSTCCAAATSSGTMSSTITCWARSRRRSTCCTGTATRPTCRPAGTATISRRSTRGTSWPRKAGSASPGRRSTSTG